MVKIEDLKRINLLRDFPDYLFEIIANEAQLNIFGAGTQLIAVTEPVDTFFMLIMGQVALKRELTPEIDIIIDNLQSGSSFGSSSMIEGSKATYTAICQETCEIITLSGIRMQMLFKQNHELAYRMMFGVARQYKKHLDTRAQMIMKTLDENPELKDRIKDIENLTLMI
ncbi:MAG: cyclic nucleotide-binding domain-containing protein [Deltaproteobacteria bacterium]|uniref:cyclic nucleotide-binding domain-containing protein n=1 Tax=Desulfobacula sp. TaxID=2593537 RepID=UPI001982E2B5|nr:cyclic nucleotide-binding domain-containing protein [Candidatus Desulfobacula maris]MBL6995291.1 cyclic nucleotide-binding domain-containing protein [Desulfobacula sp.]